MPAKYTYLDERKKAEQILNTQQETLDFPECRGMSFREFWEWLPYKLEYFDYEEELYNTLEHPEKFPEEQHKHVWVKKATGLGITEFTLRYIAWKCLKDDIWKDKQVDVNVIMITGPRIELTVTLMQRLKNLFPVNSISKSKETALTLNGNRIEAFPSHHLAPARGLNPQFVFLDEADFFPPQMQTEARMVSERYIAKTDPYIMMVSTPNLPLGLYDNMEREETSIYIRKTMPYTVGLDRVFSQEAIAKAKASPSFEREYNLQYGYGLGDIFQGLDDIIQKYDVTPAQGTKALCGDPAFGSSHFGICAGESLDGVIYVKEAKQYPRPSPSAMLDVMTELARSYSNNVKIDSAHPGFIRDLVDRGVNALPINFGLPVRDTESDTVQSLRSKMTINAAQLVKTGQVRIHPMFTDLIAQLRAAKFDKKGGVDKEELTFDIGDAFIMLCWELKQNRMTGRAFSWND